MKLHDLLQTFLTFVRFNIVGLSATLSYLASGLTLGLLTELKPPPIHLLAFALSVLVSYVGHAYFTFGRSGTRYIFRFSVITLLLFCLSTAATYLMATAFKLSEIWTVATVTALYPLLSFQLHYLWTFREPFEPTSH